MSKLYYVANIRLPTEKAHGIQIMQMCAAFAAAGAEVELLVTDRRTPITEDPFAYYGVKPTFAITRIPVPDTLAWGRVGFWFESLVFARRVWRHLRARPPGIIYGRDELVLWKMPGARVVWETHTGAWNRAAQRVAKRAQKIVAISQGLKDWYVARGVPAQKILVAHDGVDVARFDISLNQAQAREKLGLDKNAKLAVYTGSRYVWKGVGTLEQAAGLLSQVQVLVVSGKPYAEVSLYLRAADVLVLPNSAKEEVSRVYTSPMKLFEYMAAGKSIVASDVPALREILDDSTCYFFTPDDAGSLAAAVTRALGDPEAPQKAARAREKAQQYTWQKRAESILKLI